MPNLTVSIPHQLPRVEAKKRVEELIGQLKNEYGGSMAKVDERWTGDNMTFAVSTMGMSLSGQVFVEDQAVRLEVVVPFALAMFSGQLKKSIEQEGRKLLSNRPGENA